MSEVKNLDHKKRVILFAFLVLSGLSVSSAHLSAQTMETSKQEKILSVVLRNADADDFKRLEHIDFNNCLSADNLGTMKDIIGKSITVADGGKPIG